MKKEKQKLSKIEIRQGYCDGNDFMKIDGIEVKTNGYGVNVQNLATIKGVPELNANVPVLLNAEFFGIVNIDSLEKYVIERIKYATDMYKREQFDYHDGFKDAMTEVLNFMITGKPDE